MEYMQVNHYKIIYSLKGRRLTKTVDAVEVQDFLLTLKRGGYKLISYTRCLPLRQNLDERIDKGCMLVKTSKPKSSLKKLFQMGSK